MPAQVDLSKLSVRQFAERFKSEMIPLSNTFSYFCASVPLSEEDLKEYLEEPVAALPPGVAAALPKISILLVPYLERGNGTGAQKTSARDTSRAKLAAAEYVSIEKPPTAGSRPPPSSAWAGRPFWPSRSRIRKSPNITTAFTTCWPPFWESSGPKPWKPATAG